MEGISTLHSQVVLCFICRMNPTMIFAATLCLVAICVTHAQCKLFHLKCCIVLIVTLLVLFYFSQLFFHLNFASYWTFFRFDKNGIQAKLILYMCMVLVIITFSSVNIRFYQLNKSDSIICCYFHTVNNSQRGIQHHGMFCIQHKKVEVFTEKVIYRKYTLDIRFLKIFLLVLCTRENIQNMSHSRNEVLIQSQNF